MSAAGRNAKVFIDVKSICDYNLLLGIYSGLGLAL